MHRDRTEGPLSEFALRLRALRKERSLTIRALAELSHISNVTICKWEHGRSTPQPRLVRTLATALEVPVGALIGPLIAPPGADEALVVLPNAEADVSIELAESRQQQALADVIAQAKQMIAKVAGNSPDKVSIRLDF